jgi:hypothetical protein
MDKHITINHFDRQNLFFNVARRKEEYSRSGPTIEAVPCDTCHLNSNTTEIFLFKPEHSSVIENTWLCESCANEEFGKGNWC